MKRISSEILKSFFRKRFFSVVVVLSLVVSKSGAEADSKGGQKNLPAAELSERGERSLNCQHTATQFSCVKFVRNYDGDTFTVNIPGVPELIGRNISVRVRGIDTPEIKGRGACEKEAARMAKKFLSSQLRAASKVHLKGIERDKYFRILADVEVDGEDLAMKLKNAKLAVPYEGGRKEQVNWCQRLGLKEP